MAAQKCQSPGCQVFAKRDQVYCIRHSTEPLPPMEGAPMEELPPGDGVHTAETAHGPEAHINVEAVREAMATGGGFDREDLIPRGRRDAAARPSPGRGAGTEEPEILASKYAKVLLAQEQAERLNRSVSRREDRDRATDRRLARIPNRVMQRRQRPDPTRIVDPTTGEMPESLRQKLAEGWVPEWVSTTDPDGRPLEERVAYNEDWGAEYITDAEERVIEGRFGVAMMLPPEQWAGRSIERTPQGAVDRDQALAMADEIAEAANSYAGEKVASLVIERDHGTHRRQHRVGREFEE